MRVRKLTFAALAVAAGLSLTACNGDDSTAQGSGTSDSSSSSSSSTSTSSSSSSSSSSGGGGGSAGSEQGDGQDSASGAGTSTGSEACRTDDLDITATDATIDGDPDGSVAVTFANAGGQDCTLSGYAGVDLKTNAGDLSAERNGQDAGPMVLKDGESVSFGITYPINDSGGSGVRVTSLVVTPPNETKSYSLEWPGAATLPVTDGTGATPVQVGPMGSAGQGGAS